MQAAGHRNGGDFVAGRRHDGGELRDPAGGGAGSDPDEQAPPDLEHVAAVEGVRRLDVAEPAIAGQGDGDRRRFGSPGFGAGPRDDRQLVEDHRGVFDEDRIGELGRLRQPLDVGAQRRQLGDVGGALRSLSRRRGPRRASRVDRCPGQMGELTPREGRAHVADQRDGGHRFGLNGSPAARPP